MKPEINPKGYTSPKTKIGQQKMDVLINSAEELFAQNGFYDTSVADICKHAGTAVGTFYIYFKTKTDVYACLLDKYQKMIKDLLDESIQGCTSRQEKERVGIKCFVKFALQNPNIYKVIWGSLSIDEKMFHDYYTSFAKSYAYSLEKNADDVISTDYTTLSYFLMGISNFLGLRAIFENMTDEQIDEMIDSTVMPALSKGILK
ncbi:MAG: TetR/AcrR family transcriptional regulator [Clostridia bacterium]|nr:TetR/AcrR family transcriptional regulator [Clostridia bacterium]